MLGILYPPPYFQFQRAAELLYRPADIGNTLFWFSSIIRLKKIEWVGQVAYMGQEDMLMIF